MIDDMSRSSRIDNVLSWLDQQGQTVEDLTELTGDVSLRSYFRLTSEDSTAIVAAYPLEMQSVCRNFLETTRLLSRAGVRVPRLLATDCEQGFTVLEDLGSETLYDLRDSAPATLSAYFWRATVDLKRIQSLAVADVAPLNPPLNGDLLRRELNQTWTCLLEPRGVVEDPGFSRDFDATLQELCRLLDSEAPVPCHRDFMSRNFIPVDPHPELAVLDHQDLRLGPRQYDLASLLNDSLFPSESLEEEILLHSLGAEPAARIPYHRAATQRTLKAAGTYESFALRGDTRHRMLIPETLARALRHVGHLPEATAIKRQLTKRMAPLLIC